MTAAPAIFDRPFAPPLEVVLNLPAAPSVNKLRRIDWGAYRITQEWIRQADMATILAWAKARREGTPRKIAGAYELHIVLSERHTRCDLDNTLKLLIDFLRRIEVVENDSPRYLRKIVAEWGKSEHGCRVVVRSVA